VTERAEAIAAAGAAATDQLEATHQAREVTLPASRAAIRSCSLALFPNPPALEVSS
jgi:hypothetical protein